MKIKKDFILREIADETVLIPVGETAISFNGLILLNELGEIIWNKIKENKSKEEILNYILQEYDIDSETAQNDLDEFIYTLEKSEIL